MFFTAFFYISVIMKLSRAAVVISVSEETKFEVDTKLINLSYLYHFGNVKKELFRKFLSSAYKQKLIKFLLCKLP